MAKKRFTADLSGFFDEEVTTDAPETVEVSVPVKSKKAARKLSSKNFTQNLDSFLSEDTRRGQQGGKTAAAPTGRRRKRSGLDLLIRSTVQDDQQTPDEPAKPDTKRVTLIFNKEHLATLKEEAKDRKMYLKDVVQEMVAQYLDK